MFLRPRPEIESLETSLHGGLNQAELKTMGLTPEAVLDFSVCSNPFAPPPEVRKAFDSIDINRYPDSEVTEFRQSLAQKLGVAPDNILAGNGAVELIRLVALTYLHPGDSAVILEPTFGEYKVACQVAGVGVVRQWGREENNFAPGIEETLDLIRKSHPRAVFICNPNNPTGHYLTRREVEMVLDACRDGLIMLDEAYVAFVEESWSSLNLIHRGNVVILRSMTKDYSLAGLRLGYVVAHEGIIGALRRVCPPWNVNVLAQKAGVIVLEATDHLEKCQREMRKAKEFLIAELGQIGFTPLPSRANFFLVKVGQAKEFRTALLRQGILVRDCASFGLSQYIRIATRTMPECQRLVDAMREVRNK